MLKREEVLRVAEELIDEKEVLQLSKSLIRIPSITRKEHRISKTIFQRLEKWGLHPKVVPVEGFASTITAEIGPKNAPAVAFNGHMDTVEVMSGWKHDPFGAKIENGLMYGLGSLDMKCGLASMMLAFRALSEHGLPDSSRVVFQAVTGEEATSAGTRELISCGAFKGVKDVIVGEGFGGLNAITRGRRGGSYFDINVKGRAAHGSTPEKGVSAISDASKIVHALNAMRMRKAKGLKADDFRPLMESQTVLRIEGGTHTLTVPEDCYIKVIRCTIPGRDDDVLRQILKTIGALKLECQVSVKLVRGDADLFQPYVTSAGSRLVRTTSRWIELVTRSRPMLVIGLSEADDNRIAHDLGLPVICIGPGESGQLCRYHQCEEAISVGQLGPVTRIYFAAALELCHRD